MAKPKPRPVTIYREEAKNDDGLWVCLRMTYDRKQWEGYQEAYKAFFYPNGSRPTWLHEHRYLEGKIEWGQPQKVGP